MSSDRATEAVAAALIIGVLVFLLSGHAHASEAADAGRAFEPKTATEPAYSVVPPTADPELQTHYVTAGDGTPIYVETFLPGPKDGAAPPGKVPTILVMTPYALLYEADPSVGPVIDAMRDYFVTRGYAVAFGHVRGNGNSGGCMEVGGPNEIDDTTRVIEYLGRDAPWSNGRVGMTGGSYDGLTQLGAATEGDRDRLRYLKAITPMSAPTGLYDSMGMDGVQFPGMGSLPVAYTWGTGSLPFTSFDTDLARAYECSDDATLAGAEFELTGNHSRYLLARELRDSVERLAIPTLMSQGFADASVLPTSTIGFFDRIPEVTPHKLLVGHWGHSLPPRSDAMKLIQAWLDHYVGGHDLDVEKWPDAQVMDNRGQWRAEPSWPDIDGDAGQLALDSDGVLGATAPQGATKFSEVSAAGTAGEAVFRSAPLGEALHLAGQPVADLWVVLDKPDAHIGVTLEAFKADGTPVREHPGLPIDPPGIFGARSAKHLEPLDQGWFGQLDPGAPAVGEPVRVSVRFNPTELVVPAGGWVVLTVAGTTCGPRQTNDSSFPSSPSGSATTVTILHDCDHPSALRFVMPIRNADLLNVRDREAVDDQLTSDPRSPRWDVDVDIATERVCGSAAIDPLGLVRGTL